MCEMGCSGSGGVSEVYGGQGVEAERSRKRQDKSYQGET